MPFQKADKRREHMKRLNEEKKIFNQNPIISSNFEHINNTQQDDNS